MAEKMIEVGWWLTKWVTVPVLIISVILFWVSKRK